MNRRRFSPKVAWGLLIFGVVYGILCTVLILTGVLGPTLWFTVAAMALLALSSGMQLAGTRRRDDRG